MALTRTTHTVRIKDSTGEFFADVEILDAISLVLPNGFEIAYSVAAANADPAIIDNTGDGNGKAGSATSTRTSHMKRLTGMSDGSQFFDAEICDAFTITGPNGTQHCISCPSGEATPAITDNTNSGLAAAASSGSTRAQHVVKLLDQQTTTENGTTTTSVDDSQFVLGIITDAIAFKGPPLAMPYDLEPNFGGPADASFRDDSAAPWGSGGDEHVLLYPNQETVVKGALLPDSSTNDTTIYETDPTTGKLVPPKNTDPNVYVFFPPGSQGPFLGAGQGVDMGPLWWLRGVGSKGGPQQPPPGTIIYDVTYFWTVLTEGFAGYGGYPVTMIFSNGIKTARQTVLIPDVGAGHNSAETYSISLQQITSAPILTLYAGPPSDIALANRFFVPYNNPIQSWGYYVATTDTSPIETITSTQDPNSGSFTELETLDEFLSGGNNPPGSLYEVGEFPTEGPGGPPGPTYHIFVPLACPVQFPTHDNPHPNNVSGCISIPAAGWIANIPS